MDRVTQTLLGAAAAQAVFHRSLGRGAALVGAIAGELPDLDILLPPADPALPIEYHRHFTHALLFVPVGGLIASLPFLLFPGWRRHWKPLLGAAMIGCGTHGLIDACTSYGTYLWWPLSNERLAWDLISIIDPLFTLTLLIGVGAALAAKSATPVRVALLLCAGYLGLGAWQHGRAAAAQDRLAAGRHHDVVRGRVMPTLGNLLVWRSVYEAEGRFYADAVRAPIGSATAVRRGAALPVARLTDLPPELATQRVRRGLGAFEHFADGYVAHVGGDENLFADVRYSLVPEGFAPLWGISIAAAEPEPTVRWVHLGRDRRCAVRALWRDLTQGEGFEEVISD